MLSVADALFSEYGWPEEVVLHRLPMARAIAYARAIRTRYDVEKKEPTFEDEERASPRGRAAFQAELRSALRDFKKRRAGR